MSVALPREDLDLVLSLTPGFWDHYRDARIFVTGGTGFVGSWLLEVVQHANAVLGCGIDLVVLSRDPQRARARLPHIFSAANVTLFVGNVETFEARPGRLDLCIHAAADVADTTSAADHLAVFDVAVAGTRRVLDLAAASGVSRVLLTSSGAVYGTQPPQLARLAETYSGAPNVLDVGSAYAQGKRAAEWIGCAYARRSGVAVTIARIFALLGPRIPLDGPFAAGNFIRDAVQGRAIEIQGDGRPVRSYLYMADACVWLLHILMSGTSGQAYNVGSEQDVSIAELARQVVNASGQDLPIRVHQAPDDRVPAPRYVPDTTRARSELGLAQHIPLAAALRKTIGWYRNLAGA